MTLTELQNIRWEVLNGIISPRVLEVFDLAEAHINLQNGTDHEENSTETEAGSYEGTEITAGTSNSASF